MQASHCGVIGSSKCGRKVSVVLEFRRRKRGAECTSLKRAQQRLGDREPFRSFAG